MGPLLDLAAVVLSRCLVQTPECWFCNPFLGAVCGGTRVCSSLTSWRVRGSGWFCLWDLNVEEFASAFVGVLAALAGKGLVMATEPCLRGSPPYSLQVPAEGCFRIVFESAGSAGVVSGPALVVGRGITLFSCFVVLCSSCFLPLLLSRVVCFPFS
ncbi:hypothetical protein Taro_029631 [Colocasia esculenta]|uniref:Uncharacterized protein n=1 Tax=Colocasia esculenta TaxID=4460 RepID=A0A843VPK7_COLES|nr:hypothetical protein [Colocasia esculenta]